MEFFLLADEDLVLGFQFAGIEGQIINTLQEAHNEFAKVINGDYGPIGVLIVSEKVGVMLGDSLLDWQLSGKYPLIVEIPDMDGHLPDKQTLLQAIRQAVGLHV